MKPSRTYHDLTRDKLALILLKDWRTKTIQVYAKKWFKRDSSVLWNKCYGHFDPDCEPYITMPLQQPDCSRLIKCLKRQAEQQGDTLLNYDKNLGWPQEKGVPNIPVLKKPPLQNHHGYY